MIYLVFADAKNNNCYDSDNKPRKCSPEFQNIAYEEKVTATNTCGRQI